MNYVTNFSSVLHIGKWDRGGKWDRAAWNTFKGGSRLNVYTYIHLVVFHVCIAHALCARQFSYIHRWNYTRAYIWGEIRFIPNCILHPTRKRWSVLVLRHHAHSSAALYPHERIKSRMQRGDAPIKNRSLKR